MDRSKTRTTKIAVKQPGHALYSCRLVSRKANPKRPVTGLKGLVQVEVLEGEFTFYLDPRVVSQIDRAMDFGYELKVPSGLIASLRQYALFDPQGNPQSGLTFYSNYLDDIDEVIPIRRADGGQDVVVHPAISASGQLVLRTVVSLDGDVIHQVRDDHLAHPNCPAIAAAHHWLLGQLMRRLRLSVTSPIEVVVNAVPPALITITVATNIGTLLSPAPGDALATIGWSFTSYSLPIARSQLKAFVWKTITAPPNSFSGKIVRWLMGRFMG